MVLEILIFISLLGNWVWPSISQNPACVRESCWKVLNPTHFPKLVFCFFIIDILIFRKSICPRILFFILKACSSRRSLSKFFIILSDFWNFNGPRNFTLYPYSYIHIHRNLSSVYFSTYRSAILSIFFHLWTYGSSRGFFLFVGLLN